MTSDVSRPPRAVTYCSFATDEAGCLGVCILEGSLDPVAASKMAWGLKINPGGQLMAISCQETDEDVPLSIFEAMWANRGRLISGAEARDLFEAKSVRELDEEREGAPKGTPSAQVS